jgi:ABC-type lipoprotein export system ATPase subunit
VGRLLGDPEVWDDGLLRDAADRGAAAVVVATHDPEVVELGDRVVRPVELAPGQVGGPVA